MHLRIKSAAVVGAVLTALTGVASGTAQAAPGRHPHHLGAGQTGPVVVVHGLNNPRQISVTPLGSLLVAEAGAGGSHCVPLGGEGGPVSCIGSTGSISWVPFPSMSQNANPIRVVTGLASVAAPNGSGGGGTNAVAARGLGEFYFASSGLPPEAIPPDLDTSLLGKLTRTRVPHAPQPLADIIEFEAVNDPDQQGFESNAFGVLAQRDQVLVSDAAANDILRYRNGQLSVFAVLPNVQDGACTGRPNEGGTTGCDAVPTGIAQGPDGSIYVGGLSGLAPGAGRVYVLDPNTGQVTRQITGLTAVTGVAVGSDGSVYASQLFTAFGSAGPDFSTGKLTRIRPDGTRTDTPVPAPSGVAVSGRHVYVAAWSIAPAGGLGQPNTDGQIWRLRI